MIAYYRKSTVFPNILPWRWQYFQLPTFLLLYWTYAIKYVCIHCCFSRDHCLHNGLHYLEWINEKRN